MARLNPKRRRQLADLRESVEAAKKANPTTQADIGLVRQATPSVYFGSSSRLSKGLLAQELGVQYYAKPKRRKAIGPGVHVSDPSATVRLPADKLATTEVPSPKPLKRIKRHHTDKLVSKSRKTWSAT